LRWWRGRFLPLALGGGLRAGCCGRGCAGLRRGPDGRLGVTLLELLGDQLVVRRLGLGRSGELLALRLPDRANPAELDRVRRVVQLDGPELLRCPLDELELAPVHDHPLSRREMTKLDG